MTEPLMPRTTPCASCPYRCTVPGGIWDASEYSKLVAYDAPIPEQPTALFKCHQGQEELCAGWVAHRDPADLLALRMGLSTGDVDLAVFDYTTTVPLFPSGREAAAHGVASIENPDERAQAAIRKIITVRAASPSGPVTTDAAGPPPARR